MNFNQFLETPAAQRTADPDFLNRLRCSGAKINTLTALLAFARERWPTHFPADFRKDSGTPFGRGAIRNLWCAYLEAVESADQQE